MNTKEKEKLIQNLDVDREGFMNDTEKWTSEIAEILAREEVPGGLTEDHWRIIVYLRQYYLEIGCVPPVRKIVRDTGYGLRQIQKLFPNGLAKGACRIAGIPSGTIKPSFLYP